MNSWLEIQREILRDQEFIAEIEAETITLTRIGGYKATPYSLDLKLLNKVNSKSLKGIWRWWARIAIVSAFKLIDYKEAEKVLSKLLGGTEKGEGISSFSLEISDIQFPRDYMTKLITIHKAIDEFYKESKDFLIKKEPELKNFLPQNVNIFISLNPSNLALIVEHKRVPIARHKRHLNDLIKKLKDLIKKDPLGRFFEGSVNGKQGKITARFKIPELGAYPEIPRVRLLLMPREKEEESKLQRNNIDSDEVRNYLERIKEEMTVLVSEGLRFKLSLYGSKESKKVNFALSSLLLSLILGGIGSLTKRAFGSLRLLSFKFKEGLEVDGRVRKIFDDFIAKSFDSKDLEDALRELCRITIDFAKDLDLSRSGMVEPIHKAQCDIPKVPSLSNIRIKTIECPSCDLIKIGKAFTKENWKTRSKESGRELHTWILGLPRWQRRQNRGYAVKKKDDGYDAKRRISSIGARCFRSGDKNFIILFGLLSGDWPVEELLHIRGEEQEMPIKSIKIRQRPSATGDSLNDVFDVAFTEVSKRVC